MRSVSEASGNKYLRSVSKASENKQLIFHGRENVLRFLVLLVLVLLFLPALVVVVGNKSLRW